MDILRPGSLHGPGWHPDPCDSAPYCPCGKCCTQVGEVP
jgi:hypothetical protein